MTPTRSFSRLIRLGMAAGAAMPMLGPPAWGQMLPGPPMVRTDVPFVPNAQRHRIETHSVFGEGSYQSGVAAGWHYRFTPDGQAVFSRSERLDTGRIQVNCNAAAHTCAIVPDSGPTVTIARPTGEKVPTAAEGPAGGLAVARAYAGWVLGGQSFAPPPPPPAPPPVAKPRPAVKPPLAKPAPAAPIARLAPTSQSKPQPVASAAPKPPAAPQPSAAPSASGVTVVVQPTTPAIRIAPEPTPKPDSWLADLFPRHDCSLGLSDTLRGLMTGQLLCNLNVTDKLSLHGTAFAYEDPGHQKPWDPDFTYVASYAVTSKLTLTYANYAGNFYPWHSGPSTGGKLVEGLVQASYALPINNTLFGAPAGSTPDFDVTAGFNDTLVGKGNGWISLGVTPIPKLTFRFTGNYYVTPQRQQDWDGDFYYTASYQIDDRWTLQYYNYAATRWPWDRLPSTGGRFVDGSFILLYRLPI